jgi:Tfp pilus assembly protein PilE
MIERIIGVITILASIIFFSYRKGVKDVKNKSNAKALKNAKSSKKRKAKRANDNIATVKQRLRKDSRGG